MDGLDEQIDQTIGQYPAAQMDVDRTDANKVDWLHCARQAMQNAFIESSNGRLRGELLRL